MRTIKRARSPKRFAFVMSTVVKCAKTQVSLNVQFYSCENSFARSFRSGFDDVELPWLTVGSAQTQNGRKHLLTVVSKVIQF